MRSRRTVRHACARVGVVCVLLPNRRRAGPVRESDGSAIVNFLSFACQKQCDDATALAWILPPQRGQRWKRSHDESRPTLRASRAAASVWALAWVQLFSRRRSTPLLRRLHPFRPIHFSPRWARRSSMRRHRRTSMIRHRRNLCRRHRRNLCTRHRRRHRHRHFRHKRRPCLLSPTNCRAPPALTCLLQPVRQPTCRVPPALTCRLQPVRPPC
jgi:hypothetical protein